MRNVHAHVTNYAERDKQERRARANRFDRAFWLNIDLPDNPVCWLLGHSGRADVVRYEKSHFEWEKLDCRVCGKRYADPHLIHSKDIGEVTHEERRARAERTAQARVANIDRDPVAFARDMIEPRGSGWPSGKLELSAQVVAAWPPRPEGRLALHVGTDSSESPWHLNVGLGGTGVYLSAGGCGSRLASLISGGEGRDLSINFDTGFGRGFTEPTLCWNLWSSRDDGLRRKGSKARPEKRRGRQTWRGRYRTWLSRNGSLSLNPLDHLHGGSVTGKHIDVGDPVDVVVETNEGTEHQLRFTLQAWTWKRPKGPSLRTDLVVDWECKKGIGCRGPQSGRTMGSGVTLPKDVAWIDPSGAVRWAGGANGWVPAAEDALRSWVTERRHREGWKFDAAEVAS